jgi:hypothetical protein
MHIVKPVRAAMRAFTTSILVVALAVGCNSEVGNSNLNAPEDGLTDSVETQPDLPSFEDARDGRVTDDTDDAAETVDREDTSQGQPCEDDSDCPGGECVTLVDGDSAFCSNPCADDSDCPEGFECLLLADSGDDAVQRCVPSDLCIDADGDAFGVGPGCRGRDCDDSSDDINPAADEVCDGVDQDCDERVDENPLDERRPCNTGFAGRCDSGTTVCNEGLLNCEPTAEVSVELCDGVDNNCDGGVDESGVCAGEPCCFTDSCIGICASAQLDDSGECTAPDGWGEEICDGVDNDCDGEVDEGVTSTWWRDGDEDGYGDASVFVISCSVPVQYVDNADDCDDSAGNASPVGVEVCDELDNDCDGETDERVCADLPCCWNEVCEGVCAEALTSDSGLCAEPPGFGAERCDGLDNDCDGATDEGFDLGTPCNEGVGACLVSGVTVCAADGAEVVCGAVAGTGSAERCDGVDNDCDGATDEGFDLGAACSDGVGACRRAGVLVCAPGGASASCDATAGSPVAEMCDGVDNDCDGATDEGFDLGAACSTGIGACRRTGALVCATDGASAVCGATAGFPSTELCDGRDNDCDGSTDEGYNVGTACAAGVGECRRTDTLSCAPDGLSAVCGAVPGVPGGELCDGRDNDCDGSVDEGFTLGSSCSVGIGECRRTGTFACGSDGTLVVCNATSGTPGAEVCDGRDNNCDGSTDEGFDVGAACANGVGECRRTGVRVCTGDGSAAVCGAVAGSPTAEVCDGRDNDCDSSVDEGNPGGGVACSTGSPGICSAGIRQCSGGSLTCTPSNSPQTEVCDSTDNDCDGSTDEGFSVGGSCSVGVGACSRSGLWVCNTAQTGRVCSATPGSSQPEVCGNGIDEDCNGSDLACPSACSGVTRNRVWVDTEVPAYNDGFVPQIADLFEGGGRTVTRSQFLFASQLSNYDVIVIDTNSLSGTLNATTVQSWIQAGGALFLSSENPTTSQCNYLNSLVSGSGLSFSCSTSDVRSSAIDNRFNLLSGVSGNLVNVGSWLAVLGGTNAARLAGPDTTSMVGRYATFGCGSVVLWGDVEYGHTGYYTGNTATVWGLLRDWLLTIP